ncbi:MAG: ArsR/SmtB family transcription factor [Actinomycetota bacterium]|nr:metalloregulator ArsR/SmtB family transcription factor [Actinomycetota bacterium]
MSRAPTTLDPFNAIAEPKRRALIEELMGGELQVNAIAKRMSWSQPMVSKHLSVLKEVGLVTASKQGRYRVYTVNPARLKPIGDWVGQFEHHWNERLDRLEGYLHDIRPKEADDD